MVRGGVMDTDDDYRVLVVLGDRPFFARVVTFSTGERTIAAGFLDLTGQGGSLPVGLPRLVTVPDEIADRIRRIAIRDENMLRDSATVIRQAHKSPTEPITPEEDDIPIDDEFIDTLLLIMTDRKGLN